MPIISPNLIIQPGSILPPGNGLIGWYKADVGVTETSGKVSVWEDQSVQGNDLTQTTAGDRPLLKTDNSGNKLIDTGKGGNEHMDIPSSMAYDARNCSIFMVVSRTSDITANGWDNQSFYGGQGALGAKNGLQFVSTHLQGFDGAHRTTTLQGANMRAMVGLISSATETRVYINGVDDNTSIQFTASTGTGGQVFNHGSVNVPLNGAIREMFFYDHNLTAGELSALRDYCETRWNVGAAKTSMIVFDGDSITSGTAADNDSDYPAQVGDLRSWDFTGANVGTPGIGVPAIDTNASTNVDGFFDNTNFTNNLCVLMVGGNNLALGTSAASILTNIQTYVTNRQTAGFTVLVGTIMPRSDITGAEETERISLNASIVSNSGGWHDGLVDFDGDSRLQDETDLTYFNSGQVHPNATGYGVMAGIASAAITVAI